MTKKFIDDLSKYIKSIEIDGETIINNGENIKIVEVISKYSSVKKPTIKIKINDKICKRDDRLTYSCPVCNLLSNILVGRFISKKTKYCYKCKENDEEKRKNHSDFIIKSYANFKLVFDVNNYITSLSLKENFNPVLNKKVLDFIEINKTNLKNLWDDSKSEEENMKFLIDYFTEYPDEMKSSINPDNIKIVISKAGMKNSAPILMNIGGVTDFRSF
jgi:hypothetical protein